MAEAGPGKRPRDARATSQRAKRHAGGAILSEYGSTLHALRNGAHVDCHPACGWVHEHAATGSALDAVALGALMGQLAVLEQLQVLGHTHALEQLVLPGFNDLQAVYASEAQRLADRVRTQICNRRCLMKKPLPARDGDRIH